MDAQLTSNEINLARDILHHYDPAQHALNNLEKHNGNVPCFPSLFMKNEMLCQI